MTTIANVAGSIDQIGFKLGIVNIDRGVELSGRRDRESSKRQEVPVIEVYIQTKGCMSGRR